LFWVVVPCGPDRVRLSTGELRCSATRAIRRNRARV